jgi:ABC-2 type transport system ATP-binding protein
LVFSFLNISPENKNLNTASCTSRANKEMAVMDMSTSKNNPVLQVNDVTKIYGREFGFGGRKIGRKVVGAQGVTFTVFKGEIFGFLGPNGAGKTTTIRSILGYLNIQSGTIKINGLDYLRDAIEIKKSLGFVFSELDLYGNFTGNEMIKYFGKFRPIDPKFLKKLKSIFKVDLTKRFRNLSTGNKQQVVIIASLASNPDLLLLDEPSNGLDPLMATRFHNLLREMRDNGATIFFSSHNLPEVQALADRVAIIREGKIIVVESVKDLQRKSMEIPHR